MIRREWSTIAVGGLVAAMCVAFLVILVGMTTAPVPPDAPLDRVADALRLIRIELQGIRRGLDPQQPNSISRRLERR